MEHHWAAPDQGPAAPYVESLSDTHFWVVDGTWEEGSDNAPLLDARLNYVGNDDTDLDAGLYGDTEEGAFLAWRPRAGAPGSNTPITTGRRVRSPTEAACSRFPSFARGNTPSPRATSLWPSRGAHGTHPRTHLDAQPSQRNASVEPQRTTSFRGARGHRLQRCGPTCALGISCRKTRGCQHLASRHVRDAFWNRKRPNPCHRHVRGGALIKAWAAGCPPRPTCAQALPLLGCTAACRNTARRRSPRSSRDVPRPRPRRSSCKTARP